MNFHPILEDNKERELTMTKTKEKAEKVSKKAKTPAQQAKVEANRIAYEKRNEKIAADRENAAKLRTLYSYVGSDYQVLRQHEKVLLTNKAEELRLKKIQLEREADEVRRVYVEESMDGPSGEALKRWLAALPIRDKTGKVVSKGRPATFALVEEFFDFYKLPRVATKVGA